MRLLSSLFVLATAVSVSLADDAAWMQVGNAGNFTKNKQIRMVEEDVRIKLTNKSMRVNVLFKFKNEGPATTVTMAFPDGIRDYKPRKESATRAIRWFTSKVDGKSTPVKRQRYMSDVKADYEMYTHVWLKTVPFKAGQTRMVTVDYEANHGDIGDYIQDVYVLKTGATWKGKIDRATIYIDWSGLRNQMDPEIEKVSHAGWSGKPVQTTSLGSRSAKIEYRNFEPDFDITMNWSPTFWNFFLNGKRVPGIPVSEGRMTFIDGPGRDPKIELSSIQALIDEDSFTHDEQETIDFKIKSKRVQVKNSKVLVNGKVVRMKRGTEVDDGEAWVYIKDLVVALGGTFRYDSKLDRVYLKF